jgi:hypothetical protein
MLGGTLEIIEDLVGKSADMRTETLEIDRHVVEQVAEHLGNYVYLLVDPQGSPFYVGKGTASRMLSHWDDRRTVDAAELTEPADEDEVEATKKRARIDEIRTGGGTPSVWILRYGLGSEYTQVEAAAIDLLSTFSLAKEQPGSPLLTGTPLTNARREASNGHGIETLHNLITEYAAPQLDTDEPLLLIKLKSWEDQETPLPGGGARRGHGFKSAWLDPLTRQLEIEDLADSMRCWWNIDVQKVQRLEIRHAVAVYRGVTRGLFRIIPDSWEEDENVILDSRTNSEKTVWDRGFQAEAVLEGTLFDEVIGRYGRRLPTKERARFRYWPY